jgi:hypothetical protein
MQFKKERPRLIKERVSSGKKVWEKNKVAQELFAALLGEEQEKWERKAKSAHAMAIQKYKDALGGKPSADPDEQQKLVFYTVYPIFLTCL